MSSFFLLVRGHCGRRGVPLLLLQVCPLWRESDSDVARFNQLSESVEAIAKVGVERVVGEEAQGGQSVDLGRLKTKKMKKDLSELSKPIRPCLK